MNPDQPITEPTDTLKSFLKEEIDGLSARLDVLQGKIKREDFAELQADLSEKRITLESLEDNDDDQLFILRREIAALKDSAEALAVKRSWWSKVPAVMWVVIIALPIIAYIAWLSLVQWSNQSYIYNYPLTETAVAAQTAVLETPIVPSATPSATP